MKFYLIANNMVMGTSKEDYLTAMDLFTLEASARHYKSAKIIADLKNSRWFRRDKKDSLRYVVIADIENGIVKPREDEIHVISDGFERIFKNNNEAIKNFLTRKNPAEIQLYHKNSEYQFTRLESINHGRYVPVKEIMAVGSL